MVAFALALALAFLPFFGSAASAQGPLASSTDQVSVSSASLAEAVRSSLASAQLYSGFAPNRAAEALARAETAWAELRGRFVSATGLREAGASQAPGQADEHSTAAESVARVDAAFASARAALDLPDAERGPALAAARGALWTALLRGSMYATLAALDAGQPEPALALLGAREYRRATTVTTPGTEATSALLALQRGEMAAADARTAVSADLLDAYQARLLATIDDLAVARGAGQPVRVAELRSLAVGYFELLAPAYAEQRGAEALATAREHLASGDPVEMVMALDGFRAAPLSPKSRDRLAAQLFRYLPLIATEYGRGVAGTDGEVRVTNEIEITEAKAFYQGALGNYRDLEPLVFELDAGAVPRLRAGFEGLATALAAAGGQGAPGAPGGSDAGLLSAKAMQKAVNDLVSSLTTVVPADWRRGDASGDLEVIAEQLKVLAQAVAAGRYDLAESTRLDAYAVLESGPEARLRVFQPELSNRLEQLFWHGAEPPGLARLIRDQASEAAVLATIGELNAGLREANAFLGTAASPAAVAANAAIIVFREGLEAVLILAALLGSLKKPEVRRFRRPLWVGAIAALAATVVTWFALRGVLTEFARYGEKLEAVVSVIALLVLLLIMNWFFHQVYWTDHLANFHKRKAGLLGSSQYLGLALLGLSAIYREGFEVVLFLQSLVLQSGAVPVLNGTAIGFAATIAVGLVIFLLQRKLPYKKMLIVTGMLVCLVLVFMAGNTVHVLQLVGWMPVHTLPLRFPTWAGVWLGTFPTVEGLLAQVMAVALVVGSYFLAERSKVRTRQVARSARAA